MPRTDSVERRIAQIEGFDVRILSDSGADIRGDRILSAGYRAYERAASGSISVADWKQARFAPAFVGLDVDVLDGNGRPAHGRMLLRNVRESYAAVPASGR